MERARIIMLSGSMIASAFMGVLSHGAELNLISKNYVWEFAVDGGMKMEMNPFRDGLKLEMEADGDIESFPRISTVFESQNWSEYKTIVVEIGKMQAHNNDLVNKGKEIALCIYDESLKNGNDFVQTIAGYAAAKISDEKQVLSFDISKCARRSVRRVELYIYERPLQKGEKLSIEIDSITLK